MVQSLGVAAEAAAAEVEACLTDDFLLLDFAADLDGKDRKDGHAAPRGGGAATGALFQGIFDHAVDGIPGLAAKGGEGAEGGEEEEEEELEWLSNKDAFPSLETSFVFPNLGSSPVLASEAAAATRVPARRRSERRRRRRRVLAWLTVAPAGAGDKRRCGHCQAEETPQWRAGPEGPKTLCNACGVRYKSGRLLPEYRPASSPTFSPALHSNSHRRVLEMRRRKSATVSGGRRSSRGGSTAPHHHPHL